MTTVAEIAAAAEPLLAVNNIESLVRKLGVDKIGLVADKKKGGAAAAPAPAA